MAVFVVGLVLVLLSMAAHSDASYCVCNSGLSDAVLQKNIDYACGNGADCSAINPNGACYNPNTVKDHCNYAVNSYYQKKGGISGSCDFQGTATVTQTPPSGGCASQSSPSTGGTTTPPTGGTTTPPSGGTPTTGGTTTPPSGGTSPTTGGTTSPPSGGGTMTPPTGGTPAIGGGTLNPGVGGTPTTGGTPSMGSSTGMSPPGIGLAPTGTGYSNDSSASVKLASQSTNKLMLVLLTLTLLCRRV